MERKTQKVEGGLVVEGDAGGEKRREGGKEGEIR